MSETHKINKTFVDKLPFEETGQRIYRDSQLIGFALRVTSKSKTYIVERRKEDKLFRIVIGKHTDIATTEARIEAESLLSRIAAGEDPRKPKRQTHLIPTLENAYNDYVAERKLTKNTLDSYRKSLNYLSTLKSTKLDAITRHDTIDVFNEISKASPAQANAAMRMLRAIYNWASFHYTDADEKPLIKDNPVGILTAKKQWNRVKSRITFLEDEEVGQFFNALLQYQDETRHQNRHYSNNARDFYILVMFTGIRLNEGQQLKWSDVDLDKGQLIFRDTKNHDDHSIPIGDYLLTVFKQRHALKENEWVFPSRMKSGDHVTNLRAALVKLNEHAGTKITTHDLRRTYASIANNLDYSYATIKRLLNHRDSSQQDNVTLRYIQMTMKKLKLAMNEIEDAIFESASLDKDVVIASL